MTYGHTFAEYNRQHLMFLEISNEILQILAHAAATVIQKCFPPAHRYSFEFEASTLTEHTVIVLIRRECEQGP